MHSASRALRTIVHVDMDAFFAAIEQLDNPEYRGKPVIVGGPADSPRGVVSTCSYEARPFGVRSAMPLRQAARLCPDAIFLPVRGERYRQVSAQVREIFDSFSPVVEAVSVDEAFIDLTGCEHFYSSPERLGEEIKRRIYEQTRLTASVGVAPNKFVAKVASDFRKPDGLTVVGLSAERWGPGGGGDHSAVQRAAEAVERFLAPLPVEKLWGVGVKSAELLRRHGVRTVIQLRAKPLSWLTALFGERHGAHLYELARGRDERAVTPFTRRKSIGQEVTFDEDVTDRSHLSEVLANLVAEAGRRLRRDGRHARAVTLKVRFPPFETHTFRQTLASATRDDATFQKAARRLLGKVPKRPVRLLGVTLSELEEGRQASLFDDPRQEELSNLIDRVNDRLGGPLLRRGAPVDARRPGGQRQKG